MTQAASVVLSVDNLYVDYMLPGNRPAHALHDVRCGCAKARSWAWSVKAAVARQR